ncbi:hypothetical protein DFH08DRAFT_801027 [Mycena albidolilacea]|uniref:Uncharacterized protein n=1 Tax=Mycena albidolilacea TaxID=1033008 RepID=A0AAD7AHP2_9AGAR|nr:hypothetical protein DFH08DRAFT_801027 [Mycena albidolilacea]
MNQPTNPGPSAARSRTSRGLSILSAPKRSPTPPLLRPVPSMPGLSYVASSAKSKIFLFLNVCIPTTGAARGGTGWLGLVTPIQAAVGFAPISSNRLLGGLAWSDVAGWTGTSGDPNKTDTVQLTPRYSTEAPVAFGAVSPRESAHAAPPSRTPAKSGSRTKAYPNGPVVTFKAFRSQDCVPRARLRVPCDLCSYSDGISSTAAFKRLAIEIIVRHKTESDIYPAGSPLRPNIRANPPLNLLGLNDYLSLLELSAIHENVFYFM